MRRKSIQDRFWSKVEKRGPDECWLWTACLKGGPNAKPGLQYGEFMLRDKKKVSSNRFAWELTYGPIPEGMCVCHTCDVPRCCNPRHLFIGTRQDNMDDSIRKGRMYKTRPRGEKHGMSKLTDATVIEIRKRYANGGKSYKALSDEFGIPKATISHIVIGNTWRHLSYGLPSEAIRSKNRNINSRIYFSLH